MSVSCAVLLDRDGTLIEDKHYLCLLYTSDAADE